MLLGCGQEAGFEEQQHPAHTDADGGKQNVECHVGGKLDARQDDRVKAIHGHVLGGRL